MKETERKEIGKRIMEKRQLTGHSRESFSEICGFSARHLANVERGTGFYSLNTFLEISKNLPCSADYLLSGQSYEEQQLFFYLQNICESLQILTAGVPEKR